MSTRMAKRPIAPPSPLTLACNKPVGCYVIGGALRIEAPRVPRWWTRWLLRVLFDWEWRDQ